jgi:cardiolipin synthase
MVMSIIPWPTPLIALLAVSFCVLIASVVSIHALLTKRDVRAALGWIGLIWFSPILGGVVYYVFGINRVTRSALKLKHLEGECSSLVYVARRLFSKQSIPLSRMKASRIPRKSIQTWDSW